jgi:hypothetical protein
MNEDYGKIVNCLRDEVHVPHSFQCMKCHCYHGDMLEEFQFDTETGKLEVLTQNNRGPFFEEVKCKCGNDTFFAEAEDVLCSYCRTMSDKD